MFIYYVIGYNHSDDNCQYSSVSLKDCTNVADVPTSDKPAFVVLASSSLSNEVAIAMDSVIRAKAADNKYCWKFVKLTEHDREIAIDAVSKLRKKLEFDIKFVKSQINMIFDMIEHTKQISSKELDYYFFWGTEKVICSEV